MNDTLDKTSNELNSSNLEANFVAAMNLCTETHGYNKLLAFLASGGIAEKQIAALQLSEIKSKQDALILASNLVEQNGKVREAVAFKINELVLSSAFKDFFIDKKVFDYFLQAIMDINGNVCRQIVVLTEIKEFETYLCEKLPQKIDELLVEIEEIDSQSKQYVVSKRNFQLYWCLEALCNIISSIDFDKIKDSLLKTGEFYDYTIREKTAKIIAKIDNPELVQLKVKLENDENYYVRRYTRKL